MSPPRLPDPLARMPAPLADLTRRVLEVADLQGLSLLLVGGPVRDLLLDRPIVDVDLLLEADPGSAGDLAARVARPEEKVVRHERFGTASLRGREAAIDFASARSETYAHPGALPSVSPADLEKDLARRDFSVNALAMPLSRVARDRHPAIVDRAGGLRDLAARKLRVLHERSFHDDPTRALRAARLAPRLGFTLAPRTRGVLRNALRDGCFGSVSGDRLRRELERVFEDASRGLDPSRALRALDEWHVLGALEPGLELPREAVVSLRRLGRTIAEPPWTSSRLRAWVSGCAVWLGPLPPQLRRRALRRFGLRGEPARQIAEMPRQVDRAVRALARARGRGAIDAVLGAVSEEVLLALYARSESAVRRRIERYAREDRSRRPPVTGDDLVAVGLSGPAIARALERIRIAWLDGTVRNRDEALALTAEIARRSRRTPGARKRKSRRGS